MVELLTMSGEEGRELLSIVGGGELEKPVDEVRRYGSWRNFYAGVPQS